MPWPKPLRCEVRLRVLAGLRLVFFLLSEEWISSWLLSTNNGFGQLVYEAEGFAVCEKYIIGKLYTEQSYENGQGW